MKASRTTIRAALTALAVALIAVPAAHASARYGPAMSSAQIRGLQAQGVREIIVKRDPGLSASGQAALRAQAGISYIGPGPLPDTELDRAPAGRLAAAVAALRQDGQVQYAEPNGEVYATLTPSDGLFPQQWALSNTGQSVNGLRGTAGDDIGATYAWSASTGTNVTVAVVDTGVDYNSTDLQPQLTAGWDYINDNNHPQDQNGHGTHVAGIIAAAQNNGGVRGVAPSAQVEPLRALDQDGEGTDAEVAAAFDDAGADNVRIVNASLGSMEPLQAVEQAISRHPDTLYVVAAGNYATDDDDPNTPFYPCDVPAANVICVGASDQDDDPAYFSNYGSVNVDLFAPGVNILSTWLGGYAYADGTSMATPMVSGTLALMLAHKPSLTAAQLKSELLESTDQAPQLAGLSVSGGELDAAAAVAAAGGDAPYAPPGNRARPQVSGTATVGATLTTDPGSWSRLPSSYAYQWQRCALGVCAPVPGATGASYAVTDADYGAMLSVLVTATNATGSTQALSSATGTVSRPAPPPQPAPPQTTTSAPARTVVKPPTLRLTHVALVGKRGSGRGAALVFTLSRRARVQITWARSGQARGAAADVLRLAVTARGGRNRYALSALLHGRRLARGAYTLTVRAGARAVTLRLTM